MKKVILQGGIEAYQPPVSSCYYYAVLNDNFNLYPDQWSGYLIDGSPMDIPSNVTGVLNHYGGWCQLTYDFDAATYSFGYYGTPMSVPVIPITLPDSSVQNIGWVAVCDGLKCVEFQVPKGEEYISTILDAPASNFFNMDILLGTTYWDLSNATHNAIMTSVFKGIYGTQCDLVVQFMVGFGFWKVSIKNIYIDMAYNSPEILTNLNSYISDIVPCI